MGDFMKELFFRTCIFFVLLSLFTSFAHSDSTQTPVRKLGRGIANVATCTWEIPHQIMSVHEKDGAMAAWTYGLLRGLLMTAYRGLAGAYEVVTFPVPIPKGYKPILRYPEFFLGSENF